MGVTVHSTKIRLCGLYSPFNCCVVVQYRHSQPYALGQ